MAPAHDAEWERDARRPPLLSIAKNWLRLGITGFGGPPAHVALLRTLTVERHQWLSAEEFEHAVAATNVLPGPSSTQLAIYCGWRLRKTPGALIAGLCFITPGLIAIIALGAAVLASGAPVWVRAAALGIGAVVPAVALRAGVDLLIPSFKRTKGIAGARLRWGLWVVLGAIACLTMGGALVLGLLACGLIELFLEARHRRQAPTGLSSIMAIGLPLATLAPLAWTALKVGALSFGGGFVIIPLMEADAVGRHHWMSAPQFLAAVALGQLTPGPVVHTVAVVGYAAAGLSGALLAALLAFAPSFVFVILGAGSFERLRTSPHALAFLAGAGPAAIGAIFGTAVALAAGMAHVWQLPLLGLGALWLLVARRSIVGSLVFSGAAGVALGLLGASASL